MAEGKCTGKNEKRDMQSISHDVAKEISTDWKHLGRKLGINESSIKAIEADNNGTWEQAFQVLYKWIEANGHVATKVALCKALHEIEKPSIADTFCDHTVHEDYKKHDERTASSCNGTTTQHSTTGTDRLLTHLDELIWQDQLVQKINTYNDRDSKEELKTFCEHRSKETVERMISILEKMRKSQSTDREEEKRRPASEYLPRRSSEVHLLPRLHTFSEGQSKDDFPELKLILCCESCVSRLQRFELEKSSNTKETVKDEECSETTSPHRLCFFKTDVVHAKSQDSKPRPSSDETKGNTDDEINNTKL